MVKHAIVAQHTGLMGVCAVQLTRLAMGKEGAFAFLPMQQVLRDGEAILCVPAVKAVIVSILIL